MKQIIVKTTQPINKQSIRKEHKVYKVFMGNDNWVKFTNKRAADDYAIFVKKNINGFVRVSNILYSDLFKIYRIQWPAMDQVNAKKFKNQLALVDELLESVFERSQTQMFEICYSLFRLLQNILESMIAYLSLKKNYPALYEVNALECYLNSNSLTIQIIKSQIKN